MENRVIRSTGERGFSSQIISFHMLTMFSLVALQIALSFEVYGATTPQTSLYHQQPQNIYAKNDSVLKVVARDPSGILEMRCYLRFDGSSPFVYQEMTKVDNEVYTVQLPGIQKNSQTIEYLFMVVNKQKQIIISQTFFIKTIGAENQGMYSNQQDIPQQYLFKTEVPSTDRVKGFFHYPERISILKTDPQKQFGLLAGLYTIRQIGTQVIGGYFGAFRYVPEQKMIGVRGYINTKPSSVFSTLRDDSIAQNDTVTLQEDLTPRIGGKNWSGVFWRSDDFEGTSVSLTAEVAQQQDGSVIITTSKEKLGQYFQGKIYSNGHMKLYDAYDNEIWTTYYGPATHNYFRIADYVRRPSPGDTSPPLYIIELNRDKPVIVPALYLLF